MQFWIDLRLASEGGESVKRRRLTGEMDQEGFKEFYGQMITWLEASSLGLESEEDRARFGFGGEMVEE